MFPRLSSFKRLSFRKQHITEAHYGEVPQTHSYFFPGTNLDKVLDELRWAIQEDKIKAYRTESPTKFVLWYQFGEHIGVFRKLDRPTDTVALVVLIKKKKLVVRTIYPDMP